MCTHIYTYVHIVYIYIHLTNNNNNKCNSNNDFLHIYMCLLVPFGRTDPTHILMAVAPIHVDVVACCAGLCLVPHYVLLGTIMPYIGPIDIVKY